ncbi:MAG: ABC transporter permease subunit [Actinomycetes bacterium]
MSTGLVITKHFFKERRKVAAALGWMVGVVSISTVYGYRTAYPHLTDRLRLSASFSHDAGIAAVFGPAHSLETVAGFTAFRSLAVIPLIIGIWAALSATKGLRGNEDTGQWEILVSAPITRRAATLAALRGIYLSLTITLAIGCLALSATALLSHDFKVSAALFFALALVSSGYLFASVGAVASQLVSTRRTAATITGLVIGISFLIRAVADSSPSIAWVHWLSPLGWITSTAPLTKSHWLGLSLVLATTVICTGVAITLSSKRDLTASLIPERISDTNGREIKSIPKLWVKLQGLNILSWGAGFFFMSFAFGLVAHGATKAFSGSSTIQKTFGALGITKMSELFFGIIFLMLSSGLMFAANSHAAAFREQESEGYIDHLLVSPKSRSQVYLSRLLISVVGLTFIALMAGFGAFSGSSLRTGDLGIKDALMAGLNMVPSAMVLFGVSLMVFGFYPRAVSIVGQSLLAWSFLLELIGSTLKLNHYLLDTSFLHHMAFAPAASPRGGQNLLLLGIAAVLSLAGLFGFNRRDTAIG